MKNRGKVGFFFVTLLTKKNPPHSPTHTVQCHPLTWASPRPHPTPCPNAIIVNIYVWIHFIGSICMTDLESFYIELIFQDPGRNIW